MIANGARLCAALAALLPAAALAASSRANCDNLDRAETGMQGETTAAEVASGVNKLGFTCNTQLVGGVQGEGASWQLAAWKNCAYYDQAQNPTGLKQPGTVVVDVSDPSSPKITAHLTEISMLDPWESLKVNQARQLLGGAQQPGPGLAIYDISKDCAHPTLLSSVILPGSRGHAGQWAPDGNTYYVTTIINNPSIVAVDTKDAAHPSVIMTWVPPAGTNPIFHDLEFSKDGNTAYQTIIGAPSFGLPGPNGLLVLDVSDIQQRRANPTIRIVGTVTWDDGSFGAQNALPVTIAGKPYVLFTDEAGTWGGGPTAAAAACAQGKTLNGFPRLIDISDPKNPKVVGKLQIEMSDPANCSQVLNTIPTTGTNAAFGAGNPLFGYSCHYCNVDDADNATLAACSCFSAGLRIFDIRDPANPKEVGYFKPPAQGTKVLPGSQYFLFAGAGFNHPVDWAPSKPSFPKDRGMTSGEIWTTFQDNGFAVVRYSHLTSGCNNAGATFGVVALLALMPLVQRLRRRK